MGDKTAIEWADATWNPLRARHRGTGAVGWACVRVSPGCEHCYAERLNKLRGTGEAYTVPALKDVELFLDEKTLTHPLRWTRPRRIFVCSMTDLFMEQVPEEWIAQVFEVMNQAYRHTFQVLTKRPERMAEILGRLRWREPRPGAGWIAGFGDDYPDDLWPLPNVWLGVSAEDQRRADERIPWLLKTPAVVRFLSLEPLLGGINVAPFLACWCGHERSLHDLSHRGMCRVSHCPCDSWTNSEGYGPQIHWIIVGGESGGPPERALIQRKGIEAHWREWRFSGWEPKPDALEWVRTTRDQCVAARVPFFFKQFGGPTPKSAGRVLDGRTWDEFPNA